MGLRAAENFLSKQEFLNPTQVDFLLKAIHFIVHHNRFLFEHACYLQTCGTPMGASFAPSYANLFMAYWEDSCIWADNPFSCHLVYYDRYIDDVIIIWQGDIKTIQDFFGYCSNNQFGVHWFLTNTLVFLDLELFHDHDQKICSCTYIKPMAGNAYLHKSSCHLPRWIDNIPYSQFCGLKPNCSSLEDRSQSLILKKKFLNKGTRKKM